MPLRKVRKFFFDAVRYEKFFAAGPDDFSEPAFLTRYVMDLKTLEVTETQLDQVAIEFPQINPDYQGKAYRYIYGLMTNSEHQGEMVDRAAGLIKYDLKTGKNKTVLLAARYIPGEFSFIVKQHATTEDDGYLVGYVFDQESATSALWIFDARHFSEKPLAKIHLGVRVPNGFHGTWMPDVLAS